MSHDVTMCSAEVVFNNKAMVYAGAGVCAVIGTLSPVCTAVISSCCGRRLTVPWFGTTGGAKAIESNFHRVTTFFSKQFTVGVLNSFSNRCPALSRLWCPALWLSRIHLSPLIAIHLSRSLAGGVRLCGCLEFIFLPL